MTPRKPEPGSPITRGLHPTWSASSSPGPSTTPWSSCSSRWPSRDVGGYAFVHINVEAYPDPAPAIIEVVAQYPGASAEEVERQVTIPLEVALAGHAGAQVHAEQVALRPGLRQQPVRLRHRLRPGPAGGHQPAADRPSCPPGVDAADLAPVADRRDLPLHAQQPQGRPRPARLHAQRPEDAQNWTLVREFRRLPGIVDVISFGGHGQALRGPPRPGPAEALRHHAAAAAGGHRRRATPTSAATTWCRGTPSRWSAASACSARGRTRSSAVLGDEGPGRGRATILRAEERRRIREIRQIVVASTNNVPVRVEDVVDGGPLTSWEDVGEPGRGRRPPDAARAGSASAARDGRDGREVRTPTASRTWVDEDDAVQGLVMLRKGADSLPALEAVEAKIEELNDEPGPAAARASRSCPTTTAPTSST